MMADAQIQLNGVMESWNSSNLSAMSIPSPEFSLFSTDPPSSENSPSSLSPSLPFHPQPWWNNKSNSLPRGYQAPMSPVPLAAGFGQQQQFAPNPGFLSQRSDGDLRSQLLSQQQQQQQQILRSQSYPDANGDPSRHAHSASDGRLRFQSHPSISTINPMSMQQIRRPITGCVAPRVVSKRPEVIERSDSSDDEGNPSHPNKFAVAVEEHTRPECRYKRQSARSGSYVKVIKDSGEMFCIKHNPNEPLEFENGQSGEQPQILKYYRKDLVRVCRCGKYTSMEHMLENSGRANDAEGYEIHYSQKCKWKFYEDFKTKKRVLIRLCKCYKPAV